MKKHIFQVILLVLLSFSLLCTQTFAVENSSLQELKPTLDKALTTDGIYSELISSDIGKHFLKNPEEFIKSLSTYSETDINTISGMLVYSFDNKIESLKNIIEKLMASEKYTTSELKVLSVISASIKDAYMNYVGSVVKAETPYIGFNETKIKDFIASGSKTDEEYLKVVSDAYARDPKLFSKVLSELGEKKTQETVSLFSSSSLPLSSDIALEDYGSPIQTNEHQNNIIKTIQDKITKGRKTEKLAATPAVPINKEIKVKDIVIKDSTIGEETVVKFKLSDVAQKEAKNYVVELYATTNGKTYLKDEQTISVPAGSDYANVEFHTRLYGLGEYDYSLKIYDDKKSTLISDSQSIATVSSTGVWEIYVWLYQHRTASPNRDNLGVVLQLWKPDGSMDWTTNTVLGRSASGDSPMVTNGNTPTGDYSGYLYGPMSNTYSYGPYKVVYMDGVSGDIVTSGRSGIWIHGGDPSSDTSATWYPLRPTYGCVRISNSDQSTLQTRIQNLVNQGAAATGSIKIREWPY